MKILITGGCGFIGRNAAERFLDEGNEVAVLDNLSRPGSSRNLEALRLSKRFHFESVDVRNAARLAEVVRAGQFDVILHLAGQVAVTTSMLNPREDFEINAGGALNLLEAVRVHSPHSIVLNASTNKVYGDLSDAGCFDGPTRYSLPGLPAGVSESQPLDFHSPYGCSKGSADQYVMDYARCFGLRTVTFRQSCIYGYWQFGIEDQGWVAWFIIAHLMNRPITLFGTGKQVRDVLFIDDLVDCYKAGIDRIDSISGRVFNIGGGPDNTMSLLEFLSVLETMSGRPVEFATADSRPGDQPVFISNIANASEHLGWFPRVSKDEGIRRLYEWVESHRGLFNAIVAHALSAV